MGPSRDGALLSRVHRACNKSPQRLTTAQDSLGFKGICPGLEPGPFQALSLERSRLKAGTRFAELASAAMTLIPSRLWRSTANRLRVASIRANLRQAHRRVVLKES